MKKNFSKMAMFAAVAIAGFTTVACSRDDDNDGGSNAKYTVTLTGVESNDYVSLAMGGGTDTEVYNQWKVNGTTRSGESAIGLAKDDFIGSTKTYVIESSKPLTHISGSFQIINAGKPLTLSIKIEKDGKTVANDNQTLNDGQDYYKQYNF